MCYQYTCNCKSKTNRDTAFLPRLHVRRTKPLISLCIHSIIRILLGNSVSAQADFSLHCQNVHFQTLTQNFTSTMMFSAKYWLLKRCKIFCQWAIINGTIVFDHLWYHDKKLLFIIMSHFNTGVTYDPTF